MDLHRATENGWYYLCGSSWADIKETFVAYLPVVLSQDASVCAFFFSPTCLCCVFNSNSLFLLSGFNFLLNVFRWQFTWYSDIPICSTLYFITMVVTLLDKMKAVHFVRQIYTKTDWHSFMMHNHVTRTFFLCARHWIIFRYCFWIESVSQSLWLLDHAQLHKCNEKILIYVYFLCGFSFQFVQFFLSLAMQPNWKADQLWLWEVTESRRFPERRGTLLEGWPSISPFIDQQHVSYLGQCSYQKTGNPSDNNNSMRLSKFFSLPETETQIKTERWVNIDDSSRKTAHTSCNMRLQPNSQPAAKNRTGYRTRSSVTQAVPIFKRQRTYEKPKVGC